jgi:hypothetical protein
VKALLLFETLTELWNRVTFTHQPDIGRCNLGIEAVATSASTCFPRHLLEAVVEEVEPEGLSLLVALDDVVKECQMFSNPELTENTGRDATEGDYRLATESLGTPATCCPRCSLVGEDPDLAHDRHPPLGQQAIRRDPTAIELDLEPCLVGMFLY